MTEVFESGIINADADKVWSVLRDFAGVKNFSDDILSSELEGIEHSAGGRVGMIRHIVFKGEGEIREQLVALSDAERYLIYTILTPDTLPIRNYSGKISVVPVSDSNRSVIGWSGNFSVAECDPQEVSEWLRQGYRTGISGMRAYIEATEMPRVRTH